MNIKQLCTFSPFKIFSSYLNSVKSSNGSPLYTMSWPWNNDKSDILDGWNIVKFKIKICKANYVKITIEILIQNKSIIEFSLFTFKMVSAKCWAEGWKWLEMVANSHAHENSAPAYNGFLLLIVYSSRVLFLFRKVHDGPFLFSSFCSSSFSFSLFSSLVFGLSSSRTMSVKCSSSSSSSCIKKV